MKVMIQYAVPMLMLVTSEPVSQNKKIAPEHHPVDKWLLHF